MEFEMKIGLLNHSSGNQCFKYVITGNVHIKITHQLSNVGARETPQWNETGYILACHARQLITLAKLEITFYDTGRQKFFGAPGKDRDKLLSTRSQIILFQINLIYRFSFKESFELIIVFCSKKELEYKICQSKI